MAEMKRMEEMKTRLNDWKKSISSLSGILVFYHEFFGEFQGTLTI